MKKNTNRAHQFEFHGHTGRFSLELADDCFTDVEENEVYEVGKILSSFLYGFLIENKETRNNYLNTFHSMLRDITIFIEDKDLNDILRFSNRAFQNGDYENSLFLSKLVLARINQIIDEKIANNSRTVDKEIINLQISTLNFIGYLFSKLGKNIEYGVKLTKLANTLLDEFYKDDMESIALRAAISDTLGVLYIHKEDWAKAVKNLQTAHECDNKLMAREQIDEIGFRLTYSNLGYAIVKQCASLLDDNKNKINIHVIEQDLSKAKQLLMKVRVDRSPPVPEKLLKDLELLAALRRMKEGLALLNEVKKKLQKRLI
jgi:hypothetical protein